MKLDSIRGVAMEQGRLYRLWVNDKIKAGEMARGMYGLREIRCSLEAIPPERAKASPAEIHVVSIDSGQFLTEEDIRGMRGLGPYKLVRPISQFSIEHDPTPPTPAEEPAEPEQQLSPLEQKLLELGHDELLKLAETLGVGR